MLGSPGKRPGWRTAALLCCWCCEPGTFISHLKRKTLLFSTLHEGTFKNILERKEETFNQPKSGQLPGSHNLHKEGSALGKEHLGQGCI